MITARRGSVTSRSNVTGAAPGHWAGTLSKHWVAQIEPAGGTTLSVYGRGLSVAPGISDMLAVPPPSETPSRTNLADTRASPPSSVV